MRRRTRMVSRCPIRAIGVARVPCTRHHLVAWRKAIPWLVGVGAGDVVIVIEEPRDRSHLDAVGVALRGPVLTEQRIPAAAFLSTRVKVGIGSSD